jgi:hypothetical protein
MAKKAGVKERPRDTAEKGDAEFAGCRPVRLNRPASASHAPESTDLPGQGHPRGFSSPHGTGSGWLAGTSFLLRQLFRLAIHLR